MGRFRCLVESEDDRERFRVKYKIPPTVGMIYVVEGEWVGDRKEVEVVIPMIAFIEGGMTIPHTMRPKYVQSIKEYRSPK